MQSGTHLVIEELQILTENTKITLEPVFGELLSQIRGSDIKQRVHFGDEGFSLGDDIRTALRFIFNQFIKLSEQGLDISMNLVDIDRLKTCHGPISLNYERDSYGHEPLQTDQSILPNSSLGNHHNFKTCALLGNWC